MPAHLVAIDQGTTSTRAMVFDASLKPLATAQQELRQIFPRPGWVEHDPEEIWAASVATVRTAMAQAGVAASDVAALGITNQRETAIVWDRATGAPIHNAIVWQDRRTAEACEALRAAGHEDMVAGRTGLVLDPYFSATKIAWLLDNVEGARAAAGQGRLAFGTVDTFLLWRLTGGRLHVRTRAMRLGRCSSTFGAVLGTPSSRACSSCRSHCCRRCAIARPSSVRPRPRCSAGRSPSAASPATSRRRPSARAALRQA